MGNYWASWIALPVAAIVIGAALMFKERDSVSSEDGAAPAGDEPAWHGSSVEVDDLLPSAAPAQEVPPRSLEL